MTDIRRSILWVIFGFSMVLIWDQWQVHNGKPATFFPSAKTAAKAATPANGAPSATAEDPHAGHGEDAADPHAGHGDEASDPHAGHSMPATPEETPPAPTGHEGH